MDRRKFLGTIVGGVAATAAVRTWPFRVYSFPTNIVTLPRQVFRYFELVPDGPGTLLVGVEKFFNPWSTFGTRTIVGELPGWGQSPEKTEEFNKFLRKFEDADNELSARALIQNRLAGVIKVTADPTPAHPAESASP